MDERGPESGPLAAGFFSWSLSELDIDIIKTVEQNDMSAKGDNDETWTDEKSRYDDGLMPQETDVFVRDFAVCRELLH
jgi:hypothetical protein